MFLCRVFMWRCFAIKYIHECNIALTRVIMNWFYLGQKLGRWTRRCRCSSKLVDVWPKVYVESDWRIYSKRLSTQFGGVDIRSICNKCAKSLATKFFNSHILSDKNEYKVDAQEDMCSAVRLLLAMVLFAAVVIYCIGGGADRCDGGFFLILTRFAWRVWQE